MQCFKNLKYVSRYKAESRLFATYILSFGTTSNIHFTGRHLCARKFNGTDFRVPAVILDHPVRGAQPSPHHDLLKRARLFDKSDIIWIHITLDNIRPTAYTNG